MTTNPSNPKFDAFSDYYNVVDGLLRKTLRTRHGINPSTVEHLPEVPVSTQEDVDDSVRAGSKAFKEWSISTYQARREAINNLADQLHQHADEFARLITLEQGKPLQFAKAEVAVSVERLRSLAGIELRDEIQDEADRTVVVRYTPLGVCCAITPWNFPLSIACGKIAAGLITGNTVILKPSPYTPYTALKLGELGLTVLPPGVLQVLSGDDDLGEWLTSHSSIAKISFTGSTSTGRKVMQSASKTLKRLTLELGGKDAAIVCPDVDMAKVAPQIATLCFLNSGQICLAIKRVFVHESIYDSFLAAMVTFTKQLRMGDGFQEGVFLGPVQNNMQFEKAQHFLAEVERDGLALACGSTAVIHRGGYFIQPTIIDRPPDESMIVKEEPFAPIVPILSWSSEDEVITRANNSDMGLGASVWSANVENATLIAKRLEAGSVWINSHLRLSAHVPFGGFKQSGLGHEFGLSGLKSFCNVQAITIPK